MEQRDTITLVVNSMHDGSFHLPLVLDLEAWDTLTPDQRETFVIEAAYNECNSRINSIAIIGSPDMGVRLAKHRRVLRLWHRVSYEWADMHSAELGADGCLDFEWVARGFSSQAEMDEHFGWVKEDQVALGADTEEDANAA